MPSLYDITTDALRIQAVLESNDGELTPELENELDGLLAAGADKLDAAAAVLRSLEESEIGLESEADRLSERASRIGRSANRLRARMLSALLLVHGGKLKTDRNTFWNQRPHASPIFEVIPGTDLRLLPARFVKIEPTLKIMELRAAYKAGEQLPAEIIVTETQGEPYLRFK